MHAMSLHEGGQSRHVYLRGSHVQHHSGIMVSVYPLPQSVTPDGPRLLRARHCAPAWEMQRITAPSLPSKGWHPFCLYLLCIPPSSYALCLSRAVCSERNNPEVKQQAWVPDLGSAYVRLVDNLPCPGYCSEGSPLECTGTEGWFPKG